MTWPVLMHYVYLRGRLHVSFPPSAAARHRLGHHEGRGSVVEGLSTIAAQGHRERPLRAEEPVPRGGCKVRASKGEVICETRSRPPAMAATAAARARKAFVRRCPWLMICKRA